VVAFVVLSPLAGALADRLDRKLLMVAADLGRMVLIALMLLVQTSTQIFLLMFVLNALTAFFTPSFQAALPQVTGQKDYAQAIALSGATYEVLGVLGPGIAGAAAAFLGVRGIFIVDALSFLLSALLILSLPVSLKVARQAESQSSTWRDVRNGSVRLWQDGPMRYALLLELVAAVAGALVLVATVGLVRGQLNLGDLEYGWIMAAFGLGATLAALAVGALDKRLPRTRFVFIGALLSSLALLPAYFVAFAPLMFLWLLAGAGQNWVNLPTQALIADRTPEAAQGRVYGAHFAWSHLWWAGSYPLAGYLGSQAPERVFFYGGLLALVLLALFALLARRR
jgi:NRE family putative nickel resistance protein-like MFS transporter